MQCQRCRTEWPEEFSFCPTCGIPIVVAAEAREGSAAAAGRAAATVGDDNIVLTGDIGQDLSIHIVKNYLRGAPHLDEDGFRDALARYLTWLDGTCGWLTLRGIKQRDQQVLTLPLDEVYTSLTVEAGAGRSVGLGELLQPKARSIVTGAPGSGKSTVLQFVAWTLARALRTNDPHLAVERLGLRVPEDEDGTPQPSRIELPLPVFIPLHAYAQHLQRHGAGDDPHRATLVAFISDYLIRRQALGLPEDFFEQLLVRGQSCVLLLDGLDEVPDERTRVRASRAVEDLVHAVPENRCLVTSRPAAYTGETVLGARFRHLRIQPMTPGQVERLVTRLYQAAIPDEQERARETAALFTAINNLEKLRARLGADERFITTPLMVRMIVIVHFSRRQLPEQRAELYREVVEVLLAASYHPDVAVGQALAEVGGAISQRRNLLGVLAFEMHSRGQGTRLIDEGSLRATLTAYLAPQEGPQRAAEVVDEFVRAARQRGSFLDERSGRYQFLHHSFQEFLAARHLAETVRDVDRMGAFLEEGRLADPWWREPALLLLGYLSNSSPEVAGQLARRLARLAPSGSPAPGWPPLPDQARLAGAALAAAGMLEQPNAPPTLRQELADLLTKLLTAGAGPSEWASTGETLGRLGDPRPGVGLRADGTPDMLWCPVPEGPFWMGTREDEIPALVERFGDYPRRYEREIAGREVALPAYAIARYPVTGAQFQAFVEAGGYQEQRFWTPVGWAWRQAWGIDQPEAYDGPLGMPNHPAVGASWHEAVAFCRWLTDQLRPSGLESFLSGTSPLGTLSADLEALVIRLPTEAEWEKAARGTDGRQFPGGDELTPAMANTWETGLGAICAVGLFPRGASPCGALDLVGNVWEWCQDVYRPYPYRDDRADEGADPEARRVLRGGSFQTRSYLARCASRIETPAGRRGRDVGFRVVVALPAPPGGSRS
jgi:formylglycine-generating enzyme required for sulfatase activity